MLNTLKKIPQFYRYPRHLKALLEHSSRRKLQNLLTLESERRKRKTVVKGYPYILFIDPINSCNLSCPLCPGGAKELGRKRQMMDFKTYQSFLGELKDYTYEVYLYNWGEPFLNPDIFKMIGYNQDNNIGTNLSTNLSLKRKNLIEDIIDSGLEYLSVSLDGTDAQTYNTYRLKGDFALVLKNLKNLIQRKKELKRKPPFIEWQYLVTKYNEHQVQEAKKVAKEIGVDLIRFTPLRLIGNHSPEKKRELAESWFPTNPTYRKYSFEDYNGEQYLHKENCFHLYRSLAINPDGGVLPCNIIYETQDDFGNLLSQDFKEIWNNKFYRSARAVFAKAETQTIQTIQTIKTACANCKIFRKPKRR